MRRTLFRPGALLDNHGTRHRVGCVKNFFLPSKFLSIYASLLRHFNNVAAHGLWTFYPGSSLFFFICFLLALHSLFPLQKDESKSLSIRMKTFSSLFLPVPQSRQCCSVSSRFHFLSIFLVQIQNAGLRNSQAGTGRISTVARTGYVQHARKLNCRDRKPNWFICEAAAGNTVSVFPRQGKVIADIKTARSYFFLTAFLDGTTPKYLYPALVAIRKCIAWFYALRTGHLRPGGP